MHADERAVADQPNAGELGCPQSGYRSKATYVMTPKIHNTIDLVHLGCGPNARPTRWADYDGSWNARINSLSPVLRKLVRKGFALSGRRVLTFPSHVRYLNLLKRFPFPEGVVDAIYAAHVWEHLYLADASAATAECFRVLRPGGRLRLVVPDLRYLAERYLRTGGARAAHEFQASLLLRETARERSIMIRTYNLFTDYHSHKFMFDAEALVEHFRLAGFRDVRARGYLESDIRELEDVEEAGRVLNGEGIAVEGVKP